MKSANWHKRNTRVDMTGSEWCSTGELCKGLKFEHAAKWHMHKPESVIENWMRKTLWDYKIKIDHPLGEKTERIFVFYPYCDCKGPVSKFIWQNVHPPYRGCPRGVMVKARLQNRSKRVRTPVVLLRSLSDKYPWERCESPYPPSYGLNSTTTVLLEGCIWH